MLPKADPTPVAVLFPGQGTKLDGFGAAWADHPAWSVVTRAEAVLDRPLAPLLLDDATDRSSTEIAQLSVLLASLVVWEAAAPRVGTPVAFAGHSLGQVTALLASGAVGFEDGLRFAEARAVASQRSSERAPGRMAVLAGADVATAEQVCAEVEHAWVANDNTPRQVVLGGTAEGLEQAHQAGLAHGCKGMLPLAVGHAFHTPLLADARDELRPVVAATPFAVPVAPIVANTDARPHDDPATWPDALCDHLVHPVRWRETQRELATTLGAGTFLEVGPGRVLAKMARATVDGVTVTSVAAPPDLDGLTAA